MKILALETSTLIGSVALVQAEGNFQRSSLIAESLLSVSIRHSERLMPAIDSLLNGAGCSIDQVDLFAASIGPGSFTGLRIGIAACQGLASAMDKPLVGVSSLEVLASNGTFFPGLIVPVLDAYRGEVFRGIYRRGETPSPLAGEGWDEGKLVMPIAEDAVVGIDKLVQELKAQDQPLLLLGNGVVTHGASIIEAVGPDRVLLAGPIFHAPRASHLAMLAYRKWREQEYEGSVLPRYLRTPR